MKILCLALYPILRGIVGSLESTFLSSLYILDKSHLSDVELVKIFSQFVGYHFVLLTMSFALEKLSNFMRYHLSIIYLRVTIGVLFRKCSPVPMCSRLFASFFSISFSVSGFMWRSLVHIDLSLVKGGKNGSYCILLHADLQFN